MQPHLDHVRWFREELEPHEKELRAYLRGRFPTLPDLDDLIQETYARVFKARSNGGVQVARPYLFATARNAALDYFRRRNIAPIELGENVLSNVVEDKPDAAEVASHNQEIALLHEAIATLPDRCRQVLIMRRIEGRPHAEVAKELGISEKTIDAHLCLALFKCRAYLLEKGVSRDALALLRDRVKR